MGLAWVSGVIQNLLFPSPLGRPDTQASMGLTITHKSYPELRGFSPFVGVRAGEARGAAAPPSFGRLRFFGQQEKVWAKPGFKDVSMFFYCYFEEINSYILFWQKSWRRRNNPVTFSRDIGCVARDEFLVIRKGYHTLIYIFIVFYSV